MAPGIGMVELGEEASMLEVGVLRHIPRRLHGGCRNAGTLQPVGQLVLVLPSGPLGDECCELVLVGVAAIEVGEARVGC